MILPLAIKQNAWIRKIGSKYYGKCHLCKNEINCFNFNVIYDGDYFNDTKLNIDLLYVICKKC